MFLFAVPPDAHMHTHTRTQSVSDLSVSVPHARLLTEPPHVYLTFQLPTPPPAPTPPHTPIHTTDTHRREAQLSDEPKDIPAHTNTL